MEQTTKNDKKMDPLGQLNSNGGKLLSESDLRKVYGGGKATRHDLRGLVKTMWAFSEKVDVLAAAMDRLSAMLYTASVEQDEKLAAAMDRLSAMLHTASVEQDDKLAAAMDRLCERIDELINLK